MLPVRSRTHTQKSFVCHGSRVLNLIIHVPLARDVLCLKWMNEARVAPARGEGSILNLAFGKQGAIILLPKDVAGWLRSASGNVRCAALRPHSNLLLLARSALIIDKHIKLLTPVFASSTISMRHERR